MATASSFAKAFPSRSGGFQKSATAYMSLGTYLGNLVSQDGEGHVWGPVKDLGEDATRIDRMRIYRANARWTQALTTLEDVSALLSLHMIHAPRNTPVAGQRARTAYTDHAPPLPRRHLLRLWIATPESEGGWKLPFRDSADARRGGVQTGGQSSVVVLDAE
ncbi:hypothetical protein MMC22_001342 [Lobaria immixta]|nr:hypothetical protein [Lobaria immixta]